MPDFKIDFLDHVAIRVKDLEVSARWYQEVLGLKQYKVKEWGDFPIFMLSGRSGVALFPANVDHPVLDPESKNVKMDHFAFHVTGENFAKARDWFHQIDLKYKFQDHIFFHSIYLNDPDGHEVELTTLVVPENEFY